MTGAGAGEKIGAEPGTGARAGGVDAGLDRRDPLEAKAGRGSELEPWSILDCTGGTLGRSLC